MAWRPADILFSLNLIIIAAIFLAGRDGWKAADERRASVWKDYYGRQVKMFGRVCEEAEVSLSSRRLIVCTPARVLVFTNLYPAYDYGDFLQISGRLKEPVALTDFDYPAYLARYGLYASLSYPRLARASGTLDYWQQAYRRVLLIKQGIKRMIERQLPEPEAGLATAILLGYRRTLPESDLEAFSRTGLSHLIAISGSHISVLVGLLLAFLFFLGLNRRAAVLAVLLFLLFYPVFTGLSASAVRASLMGGLAFLAISWGRPRAIIRLLVLAAAAMLAVNPRLLRSDLGFQLSFLSLLGIIYIQPLIRTGLKRSLGRYFAWPALKLSVEAGSLTLAAQLAVMPLIMISFKQLSLVAPLANILVAWLFAPLLALIIIAVLLSLIWPAGGLIWFWPAYILLKLLLHMARMLSFLPGASWPVAGFTWPLAGAYYLGLSWLVLYCQRRKQAGRNKNPSRSREGNKVR